LQDILVSPVIDLTPHMRILVAIEPIDFRVGMDGLVNACKMRLQSDPFSGAVFVFGNRSRTEPKLLVYDGQARASGYSTNGSPAGGSLGGQRTLQRDAPCRPASCRCC
jgi:hypothetical protein